jgi:hypothetical protein
METNGEKVMVKGESSVRIGFDKKITKHYFAKTA